MHLLKYDRVETTMHLYVYVLVIIVCNVEGFASTDKCREL